MHIYKRDIKKAINFDENRLPEKLENNNKIRRSHKKNDADPFNAVPIDEKFNIRNCVAVAPFQRPST